MLVTDYGRPVARLIPEASNLLLADLISKGEAEAATTPKDDWLPESIDLAPGVMVSDLVTEQGR